MYHVFSNKVLAIMSYKIRAPLPLPLRRWWAELVDALTFNCPGGSQPSGAQQAHLEVWVRDDGL